MENKKAPQIMKRSERGVIDKAVSGAVNYGDDAESVLARMYGVPSLDKLSDDQVYGLFGKARDLTGHLGLDTHSISDADPKALQKLLAKEYGPIEQNIPALITESDPEKFIKKYNQAAKLGYASPDALDELVGGRALGMQQPSYDKQSGILVPKSIAIAPEGSVQSRAGVTLHEGSHALDDIMGETNSRPYDWDAVVEARKNQESPFDAIRRITKGHHPGVDNYELDKATQFLRGSSSLDKASEKAVAQRAADVTRKMFGEGFKKIRSVVGPAVGVGGALLAGSADEALADTFVPGGVESLGKGSDLPQYADDTGAVQAAASSATDPNIRRMALQELKNRSR